MNRRADRKRGSDANAEVRFSLTRYVGLAATIEQFGPPELPEVILAGRSNAGKSSLINALAGQRALARTSRTPGKTRQILFFDVDGRIRLVDLPGYGHSAASRQDIETYSTLADAYLRSGRPVALMLLLLDCRIEPSALDRRLLAWANDAGHPSALVLTKTDKISKMALKERRLAILKSFGEVADGLPCFPVSVNDRASLDTLRQFIGSLA